MPMPLKARTLAPCSTPSSVWRGCGKHQGPGNSTQPVGFSAAVISYCAHPGPKQKQHQCSETGVLNQCSESRRASSHAAGRSPAWRPRAGPHWGKGTLSPASAPGVLQSAIQELKAQTFHHPEAPEEIIGLCAEAQMDTGWRGGLSSVHKPKCLLQCRPRTSLVHRAEN